MTWTLPEPIPGVPVPEPDLRPARAARNTAIVEALVDLPPVVISDVVGISPVSAARWALADDRWPDYLASRQA